MKKRLIELIVCPHGLPYEYPLVADIIRESAGDIETGTLNTLTEDDRRGRVTGTSTSRSFMCRLSRV